MTDLLLANGFKPEDFESSLASCPGKLFFLKEEFLQKYFPIAKLPQEKFPELLDFANFCQKDPAKKSLLWHLHKIFTEKTLAEILKLSLPDLYTPFGIDSGKIYLLLAMSLIPFYEARSVRENFPLSYAHHAADRIGSTTCFFAWKYDGHFGLLSSGMNFLLHFKNAPMYRIGRFDFVITRHTEDIPEIYRNGSELKALCLNNWQINAAGYLANGHRPAVRTVRLVKTEQSVTGTPVDFSSGKAELQEITLDLDKWEKVSAPEDWSINFHIPGGGGMTPELCEKSFAEAKEFFRNYFPDKPAGIFWSSSWIFSSDILEYLPESNLAKLIKRGFLFPARSTGKDGLRFVFGREDDDYSSYEQKTSLQKAMLRCLADKKFLRRSGWFIPVNE